jgi:nucleoside-diphosphate-sugar epimerase
MKKLRCAVIFGGTGFIGSFFANHLLNSKVVEVIYLLDIESVEDKYSSYRKQKIGKDSKIVFLKNDVRSPVQFDPVEDVVLIANFAAIHREPGHEDHEYYQTNLLGAENVCEWAEKIGCNQIIFTSSIAPYGPSENVTDEKSLPVPLSAYGGSKLVAEKIHQIWLEKDPKKRNLVIVRPGVVFGPGEGGNVSRLINAVIHRYFFYMGNQSTRKAGIYVKELCNAMTWMLEYQKTIKQNFSLFNMTTNPGPSIKEYVEAVCFVGGFERFIPSIPYRLLLSVSYLIDVVARLLNIKHPFSPVRIKKLVRSNNILPTYLVNHGYQYQYSLKSAFADWKKECPEEWK